MVHTTMNENIYPQIPQIAQIIFSFSLRPPRSLRFIFEGDAPAAASLRILFTKEKVCRFHTMNPIWGSYANILAR